MSNKIPGPHLTEVSKGSSISSKNQNITVIVGTASTGPLHPTEVFSQAHAEKVFGPELDNDFGLTALFKIIDNAESAIYCRVCHKGDKARFITGDTMSFVAKSGGEFLNTYTLVVKRLGANGNELDVVEGATEFIRVKLVKDSNELESIECSINPNSDDYIEKVFNSRSMYLNFEILSELYTIDDVVGTYTLGTTGTHGADYATTTTNAKVSVKSKYLGSILNNASFKLSVSFDGRLSCSISKNGALFELIPQGIFGETKEQFMRRVNESSEYIEILSISELISGSYILSGGDAGLDVDSSDYIGGSSDGLKALADPAQYSITTLLIPGVSDPKVLAYAQSLANTRQDFAYIADSPLGLKSYQVSSWLDGKGIFSGSPRLDSSYVFAYSPWVSDTNYRGTKMLLPPSILVAAKLCKNDQTYNIWDACAGTQRGIINTASGLEYNPDSDDIKIMYTNGNINPIIYIKDKGFVIWGNKTCKRATYPNNPEPACSANVRRMVNHVKSLVRAIALDFTFELNDEFTWDRFKIQVEPRLRAIKDARGLYSYEVIMDETTVTPDKINSLEMPGIIRLTPTRTGEVIEIGFELYPANVIFTDNKQ